MSVQVQIPVLRERAAMLSGRWDVCEVLRGEGVFDLAVKSKPMLNIAYKAGAEGRKDDRSLRQQSLIYLVIVGIDASSTKEAYIFWAG